MSTTKTIDAATRKTNTELKISALRVELGETESDARALQCTQRERILKDAEGLSEYTSSARQSDRDTSDSLQAKQAELQSRIDLLTGALDSLAQQAASESLKGIVARLNKLSRIGAKQHAGAIAAINAFLDAWRELGETHAEYQKLATGEWKTTHDVAHPDKDVRFLGEISPVGEGGFCIDFARLRSKLTAIRVPESPLVLQPERLTVEQHSRN